MPSYDVMPEVQLYQPKDADDALNLADKYRKQGWLLGGGQDTYGWLKDRAKNPSALIDLNDIDAFKGIKSTSTGIEIGALTTLRDIIKSPVINENYEVLVKAAKRVASPQIRNVGTLGGNLIQDTRCWYYRRGLACYRAGGNLCYADSPEGMNREHALFNASRCVAVSPSDTATALVALDATMVINNVDGEHEMTAEDFFVGPDTHITRMTALEPGEILTSIKIPNTWANSEYYFEKIADRDVWDFALVSIAMVVKKSEKSIQESRMVCGGVACTPYRLDEVEQYLSGNELSEEVIDAAAKLAAKGAKTLNYNHFKIPLMENLVKRALRS
ncbi:MAG: xanthine dehydrogenase family protein subunit M [Woeseiaceae bacterium]|nr:xanthine dehydrogenase family protein subunit M [Woeseiaceae bacterium]MDG1016748.1 xanthine dehydrogenase family protein subunit M [Woeseiaceae bacterium]MDG1865045.1 xanthine dehydrogenase family protein subunit M [Woeseiaceae bacterium]